MRAARAFSLVEAVVSTAIVGMMFAAGISVVGASRLGQFRLARGQQAHLLAQALMEEVLAQGYSDSEASLFGTESGEATGTRAAFDDVDDYNDWSASPPQDKSGSTLDNLEGWRRTVSVAYANPADTGQLVLEDLGVKRITVAVYRDGAALVELVAVRSRGKDAMEH